MRLRLQELKQASGAKGATTPQCASAPATPPPPATVPATETSPPVDQTLPTKATTRVVIAATAASKEKARMEKAAEKENLVGALAGVGKANPCVEEKVSALEPLNECRLITVKQPR